MLQRIYEWSVRNSTAQPENGEKIQIDPARIAWLKEAWDATFVTGEQLMTNCMKVLEDKALPEEEQCGVLEELADLLENIDNSVVFGLKKYWK